MCAPPPASAFKITPSTTGESEGRKDTSTRKQRRVRQIQWWLKEEGKKQKRERRGRVWVRSDSVTPGTRVQHWGFHLTSRHCGSSSVSCQHCCLCSGAYITSWLLRHTVGKTISRSGNECTRLSIELTEGGRRHFSRPRINPTTPPQ